MKIKEGVIIDGIKPPMLRACAIVDEVFLKHTGHEATLTSGRDGKHSDKSLHYDGLADDYRTRDVPENILVLIYNEVRSKLPPPYEVIREETHMHIEYDLKG